MNIKVRNLLEPLQVMDYELIEIKDELMDITIYIAYDNKSNKKIIVDPQKQKTIEVPNGISPEVYAGRYLDGKFIN